MFSFFVGWRYTGARRRSELVSFISSISIGGLVLSVSLLVVVLSVMNGFDKEMRERLLAVVEQASIRHRDGIADWQSLRNVIKQHPHVEGAAPFVELAGLAYYHKKGLPLALYGIDPDLEGEVSNIGQYLSPGLMQSLAQRNDGIILGEDFANSLGISVGQRLRVIVPSAESSDTSATIASSKIEGLEVLGTFKTGTKVDSSLSLTSLQVAQRLSPRPDTVTGLRLKVDDVFDAPYIVYSLLQELPYGYLALDWTRVHGNMYRDIQMSKSIVEVLLFFIIAIAVFNVVSTLVMVVVDKQSDIAILRTLGATTKKIMAIFMVQGSFIGIIGTLVGVALGLVLAYWVTDIVSWLEQLFGIQFLKSDVYPTSFLPSDIRALDVIVVACISFILSFFATVYPAWRASRVKPAEALRFDV